MSYDQDLVGPFLLSQMPDAVSLEVDDLQDAIDEFVRYGLPPFDAPGGCSVADSNGVLAIGYINNGLAPTYWTGVRAAVELLREHPLVEPLLMATIEMELEDR